MSTNIFMSGELHRKVDQEWKKEYVVLKMMKMLFSESEAEQESPTFTIVVALIESLSFSSSDESAQRFEFTVRDSKQEITLAAASKEDREKWVSKLRSLVPKAKEILSKHAMAKKSNAKTARTLLEQATRDAIEQLQAAADRVVARSSFKIYADALCDRYEELLTVLDGMGAKKEGAVKECVSAVSNVVDASNSTAAICANAALQSEIGVHARDISSDAANIVPLFVAAAAGEAAGEGAQVAFSSSLDDLKDLVRESLAFVRRESQLQEQLEQAKRQIEEMASSGAKSAEKQDVPVEQSVEELEAIAREMQQKIQHINNTALLEPTKLGSVSADVAAAMQDLLRKTHSVAFACGIDPSAADPFASCGAIDEHKKQQLLSMLNAAQGFAAATANVIEVLKHVPNQHADESLRHRLTTATASAESTLHALVSNAQNVEPASAADAADAAEGAGGAADGEGDADADADVDAERALLDVLATLEEAATQMRTNAAAAEVPEQASEAAAGATEGQGAMRNASSALGDATVALVKAAAAAQTHLKSSTGGECYRKDKKWARGLVAAARVVADAAQQLGEVSSRDDATPEETVAAARCVNGATARLVAISRSKGDPELHQAVEKAARAISQATNQLVNVAKARGQAEAALTAEQIVAEMTKATSRGAQIRAEFEAQAKIAALEHQLDEARNLLFTLRRAVYGSKN